MPNDINKIIIFGHSLSELDYSDFKNIFSIFLTGYITEGQTEEHLMRQVVHDYYSKIVATKQVKLYASGNQSLELTIIGTI